MTETAGNLQLVAQEDFGDVPVDFYRKPDEEVWMTREQIGTALGYVDPRVAIAKLHHKHKDRLDRFSVVTDLVTTDGKAYQTYLYSPKGVYEICRWSRQPKADAFYDWVYEVLEKLRTKQAAILESFGPDMSPVLEAMALMATANAQLADKLIDVTENHARRLDKLEYGHAGYADSITIAGDSTRDKPGLDTPTDILAAIYTWAQRHQDAFYGRGNAGAELWGRWDGDNWKFLSFYPDKIRSLINLYGGDPNQILRAWRARGWLETNKEKNRFTKTVRMGGKPVRLISVKRRPLQRVGQGVK